MYPILYSSEIKVSMKEMEEAIIKRFTKANVGGVIYNTVHIFLHLFTHTHTLKGHVLLLHKLRGHCQLFLSKCQN